MSSSFDDSYDLTLRKYRSLLTLGSTIASHLDLHELVRAIARGLREIVPHDAAILVLRDDETGQLRLRALDAELMERPFLEGGETISSDDTPEGHAITSGRPVLVGPTVDLEMFSSPLVRRAGRGRTGNRPKPRDSGRSARAGRTVQTSRFVRFQRSANAAIR